MLNGSSFPTNLSQIVLTFLGKAQNLISSYFKHYNLSIYNIKWAKFFPTSLHSSLLVHICTIDSLKNVSLSIYIASTLNALESDSFEHLVVKNRQKTLGVIQVQLFSK